MERIRIIKISSVFVFFLLIGINGSLFGYSSKDTLQLPYYPKYKEVILKFLKDYSIAKAQLFPNQFSLIKKPDGWHAIVTDNQKNRIITDELFWDREKDKYRKTNFPESIMANAALEQQNLINDWQHNYYTGILPYWGYAGWDKDVIRDFDGKTNLSDTLLNALARAYSSRASNFLNNNTGFSLEEDRFELPNTSDALTDEQLKTYRKYEHKSIEYYYKLWQQNPNFETFVADVYNVYSNEIMNSFLTLLYHQNREEARKELKKGLYDSFFIDMAKRYLVSCDSNAILFVNGDSDTYPLLYVQEMEGYRKDVTVINVNMLSAPRYVAHLFNEESYYSKPIDFTMDKEIYQNGKKTFFYINEEQDEIKFNDLIEFVSSTKPETKLKINDGYYNYIPSKNIVLNTGNDNEDTYIVNLQRDYLYSAYFSLLDIVGTNKFKRPVYFATTVTVENFMDFQNYFLCEGLTYRVDPLLKDKPEDNYAVGFIDTELQFNKLIKQLNFELKDPIDTYFDMHQKVVRNYRFTYCRLAKRLIDENKKGKALKVLDYINTEFPFDKVEPGYFAVDIIESYYRLNKTRVANELVKKLVISTLEDKIDELTTLSKEDYETRLMIEILRQLEDLTTKYVEDSRINQDVRKKYYMVIDNVGKEL